MFYHKFFGKPKFSYIWNKSDELKAIQKLQKDSKFGVPNSTNNQLLIATWNIANFGIQAREDDCYNLIAEIIKPFDLIAIQEVNDDLTALLKVMKILGKQYSCIFTDVAGNEERLCYIYKPDKIRLTELIGELSFPPTEKYSMTFEENGKKTIMNFGGFDRNPYVVGWEFENNKFTTYNVHIYYGLEKQDSIQFRRRILEVDTLARSVSKRIKKSTEQIYSSNIFLLGDMNIPKMKKDDPVYQRLIKYNMEGLLYHEHLDLGSTIYDTNDYDQLVFVKPFSDKIKMNKFGIFAWDNAVFADLWNETKTNPPTKTPTDYRNYAKWAISDHRVLWSLLDITN